MPYIGVLDSTLNGKFKITIQFSDQKYNKIFVLFETQFGISVLRRPIHHYFASFKVLV